MAPRNRRNKQPQKPQGSVGSSDQGIPETGDGSPPGLNSDPTDGSQHYSDSNRVGGDDTTRLCKIYAVDVRNVPTSTHYDEQTEPTTSAPSVSGQDRPPRRPNGDVSTHSQYSNQGGLSNTSDSESISWAAPVPHLTHGPPLSSYVASHPNPFTSFPSGMQASSVPQFPGVSAEREMAVRSYEAGFTAAEQLLSSKIASAFMDGYSRGAQGERAAQESRKADLGVGHRSYDSDGSDHETYSGHGQHGHGRHGH